MAPPMIPGTPPTPSVRKVPVEYRYAKLPNNSQVFIVKADGFPICSPA